jgi:hypothetical protein
LRVNEQGLSLNLQSYDIDDDDPNFTKANVIIDAEEYQKIQTQTQTYT